MKKHVLLCNLAGELNIGSLRRLSALHSTFFLLMENISTSSGGSSCCCLHFARSCFPLILSSDYSVFVNCIQREGKKKQQKGNLNIRQSFNPTTTGGGGGGVILLGVNNVWRLRLLDF